MWHCRVSLYVPAPMHSFSGFLYFVFTIVFTRTPNPVLCVYLVGVCAKVTVCPGPTHTHIHLAFRCSFSTCTVSCVPVVSRYTVRYRATSRPDQTLLAPILFAQ